MTITLNGTTGITTPDVTSDGLTVDSTTLVVDEANNRVGVGTGIPIAPVDIYTETGTEAKLVIRNHTATSPVASIELRRGEDSANFGTDIYGDYRIKCADGALIFEHGASNTTTERARIDSSGNLLVGKNTLSLSTAGTVLTSTGTITSSFAISANEAVIFNNITTGTSYDVDFRTNGASRGRIRVTDSSVAYITSSDYRLKEDWQPMAGASERVKALKPVNFAWKVDGSRVDGFLAHEAQAVVPEAVTGEKDAVDAEGNPEYQGIDQSKLVPLLTAALQEALAKIDDLTARVSALEATNV